MKMWAFFTQLHTNKAEVKIPGYTLKHQAVKVVILMNHD